MTTPAHPHTAHPGPASGPLPLLRPWLRPIAWFVITAHLALVLQPLSAIAQSAGQQAPNPVAQAQLKRYQALSQQISQAQADRQRAALTPAELLPEHLQNAQQLSQHLRAKAHGASVQDHALQADWSQLQSTLKSIQSGNEQALAEITAAGRQLRQQGADAVILERQAQAERQLQERIAQFERIAAPLLAAASPKPEGADQAGIAHPLRRIDRGITRAEAQALTPALAELEHFLAQNTPAKSHSPLDPKQLPWGAAKATPRAPAETAAQWEQTLKVKPASQATTQSRADKAAPKAKAQTSVPTSTRSTTIAGLQFTHPPAPDQAPTAADLGETEDIQFSTVVKAQAAELGHNPVAIVRWVRNNIEWIPTWGSVQGSELTLLNQRGNAIDIASLTIALLRASGIPARYVLGTVDVDAAQAQNWIGGASSPQLALDLMQQGGIAARGVVSGGRITKIRMEHAWVQAYVNWAPSRGALQGGGSTEPETHYAGQLQHPNPNAHLNAWVDIDPSYKQYTFSKPIDIAAAVPVEIDALRQSVFSTVNATEGYLAGFNEPAVLEQLQRYFNRVDTYLNSRPNLSLGDLVKIREVVPDMKPLLSGSSPFPVLASWQSATLPANLRHRITLQLYATALDRAADSPAFVWSSSLPALGIKRLGVTHLPASAADQQTLQSVYDSGSDSIPAYLLNFKPTLQIDGSTVASAPAMGAGQPLLWRITLTDPSGVNTRSSHSDNTVGDEIIFGINGNGIGPDAVLHQLAQGQPDTAAGNLEQAGLHYWMEHDQFDQMLADRLGVLTQRMPSVAVLAAPLSTRFFFGVPRSGTYKSRSIDVKQVNTAAAAPSLALRKQFALHAGIHGSGVEGSVFDQLLNRAAETSVSTTQLLSLAARQGQRIYSINSDNVDTAVPQLGTSDAVKQDIRTGVAAGLLAYVHERDISHKGYTGTGYLLLNAETGEGAYLIDGGQNGGSQSACAAGARPPQASISVHTILNWDTAGPALVGLMLAGASTQQQQQALQAIREFGEHMVKPLARRIVAQVGVRAALSVPAVVGTGAGVLLPLGLGIGLLLLIMMLSRLLDDLGINRIARSETDTCDCTRNPNHPDCQCTKKPVPKKPAWNTNPTTAYERRVDWHHRCADNSGNSYAGMEVEISEGPKKKGKSVDLFNEATKTACEVKTSFRETSYNSFVMRKWRNKVKNQIEEQKAIADKCGWGHCVIVNKYWLYEEIESMGIKNGVNIIYSPSCARSSGHIDQENKPDPGL